MANNFIKWPRFTPLVSAVYFCFLLFF
uniref:Uncharacterized protein n=1 Tax=Rhizophora mucronata TaxID=61149 RepID=A0A2P2JBZ3_RHIMU